ncbi:hypothetical protein AVEN_164955-1 [Araneus ventricosus]|uniref:Uncharacterized protein n=1 Tax=Araneus ventricosus TaxID=182803 RepID=A0A4Y2PQZ6_ARAVE|nr:hypothetical protein AVEN_164955-1 [Araneus ventricosus]
MGKYEMTATSPVWTPDLGDHLGDFVDEIWDLKCAGIFSISLLGEKIRHECARSFHVTPRPAGEKLYKESVWMTEVVVDRLGSPWIANVFGVLSAVRASKLRAIESAVIVVTSYLLTVCVVKCQSAKLLLSVNCCLFTLVIGARTIVSCTCATCFPAYL